MKKRKTLILITNIFPYGYGESFLETELFYLSNSFETVIILPLRKSSRIRSLLGNVRVSDILTEEGKISVFSRFFLGRLQSIEFRQAVTRLTYGKRILCFLNLIFFQCKAIYIKNSVERYVNSENMEYKDIIFYTYWLASAAYGLGLLKREHSDIKLFSRAHGFDVYAQRWFMDYIPVQLENILGLDKLFLISNDGYKYLAKRYSKEKSEIVDKMRISRLGVKNGIPIAEQENSDSEFRILTCSNFGRIKRLDLIIDALAIIGDKVFEKRIKWTHIGGRKTAWDVRQKNFEMVAKRKLKENITLNFFGILPHNDVLKVYQNTWFDLFINMSDSEGIPVSIMEVMSFGIPVVARDVGGISEIVNKDNGILLTGIISAERLADVVLSLIKAESELHAKRLKAMETCDNNFNADANYGLFVKSLFEY